MHLIRIIKLHLLIIKLMEKIIEKFLSDEKIQEKKTHKESAVLGMEIGVSWSGD